MNYQNEIILITKEQWTEIKAAEDRDYMRRAYNNEHMTGLLLFAFDNVRRGRGRRTPVKDACEYLAQCTDVKGMPEMLCHYEGTRVRFCVSFWNDTIACDQTYEMFYNLDSGTYEVFPETQENREQQAKNDFLKALEEL